MLFSCAFLPLAICAPAAGRMRRPSSCSRGRCSGAPCGGPAPAVAGRSPPPPREARPRRRRRRIQRAGAAGGAAARPWGREGEGSSGLWQLGSPSCYALLPLGRSAVCLYGGPGSCAVTTATVSYAVPPSEPSKRPTMVKIGHFLFYQVSSPTCTVSLRYLGKKQQGT